MTLLDILIRAAGEPMTKLVTILQLLAAKAPQYQPEIDEIIAKLNGAVPAAKLVEVAELLPREIANILGGKIDPRKHPSDAA